MAMKRTCAVKFILGIAAAILGLLEMGTDVSIASSLYTWCFPAPQSCGWDYVFQLMGFAGNVCSPKRRDVWDYVFGIGRPPDEHGIFLSTMCYIYGLLHGPSTEVESGFLYDIQSVCYTKVNTLTALILRINALMRETRHSLRESVTTILLSLDNTDVLKMISFGLCFWIALRFFCAGISACIRTTRRDAKQRQVKAKSTVACIASRFTMVKQMGSNNCFSYFHAKSKTTQRDVFLKCLQKGCSKSTRKSLEKEYRMMKDINQPGITSVLDWVQSGTTYGLGLEFAPFGHLREAMFAEVSPIRSISKFIMFRQIVSAVEFLHDSGMAHLNIRPGNVLVFKKWSQVKLSGFEEMIKVNPKQLCRAFDLHPISIPPEVRKKKPYNAQKADIWALGSLFFYILTGDYLQKDTGLPLERLVFPCLTGCDWDQKRGALEMLNCSLFPIPHRRPDAFQLKRKFKFYAL